MPLLAAGHPDHDRVRAAVGRRILGLAGHAAFESFSVLTRIRPPVRLSPADAAASLHVRFPRSKFLGDTTAATLIDEMVVAGVDGGSVFDALVGATAREHGLTLLTRDVRAVGSYRALAVDFELIR